MKKGTPGPDDRVPHGSGARQRVGVRLSKRELMAVKRAAKRVGKAPGTWARQALVQVADLALRASKE